MYQPNPIDTSNVELPEELIALTELIAKNTHDVWSKARFCEGWVYGPEKNSEKRTNPCLVPYEELPESEKNYDRNTALEALRLIVKLGYRIVKAENEGENVSTGH